MSVKTDKFEKQCVDYLIKHYGNYANFTWQGGTDWWVPDILVEPHNGENFYIEVKMPPKSQGGQFMLYKQNNNIIAKTRFQRDSAMEEAERYFNTNVGLKLFDKLRNGSQSEIDLTGKISTGRVVEEYANRGVKFFMSMGGGKYFICPIEQFDQCFRVQPSARFKSSGYFVLAQKDVPLIETYMKKVEKTKFALGYTFEIGDTKYKYVKRSDNIKEAFQKAAKNEGIAVIYHIQVLRRYNGSEFEEILGVRN